VDSHCYLVVAAADVRIVDIAVVADIAGEEDGFHVMEIGLEWVVVFSAIHWQPSGQNLGPLQVLADLCS